MKRIERSPVLGTLIEILESPLDDLHVFPDDYLFLVRIHSFELCFVINLYDIPIALISGSVDHGLLELKPFFDIFLID